MKILQSQSAVEKASTGHHLGPRERVSSYLVFILGARDGTGALRRGQPLTLGRRLDDRGVLAALRRRCFHEPRGAGHCALRHVHEISVYISGDGHLRGEGKRAGRCCC